MKFRGKLTICMTVIIIIMYGIGGALLIMLSFRNSINEERENAFQSYRSLCSVLMMVNGISTPSETSDVASVLKELGSKEADWYAVRLYDDSEIYYNSRPEFSYDEELKNSSSESECAGRIVDMGDLHYMQVTGKFQVGNKNVILDVVRDVKVPYNTRDGQLKLYHMLAFVIVFLSMVISYIITTLLTRSLKYLSTISRKIAGGSYDIRAKVKSGDEMELLAEDFNMMAESLVGKIEELRDTVERQERFTGSFAHEMKTPMTSIIGYADMLRSMDMTEEEKRESAEYIFHEARRLEGLSLKLLDLLVLKKHDFTLREASPSKILRETAELVNEKLKYANIMLRFSTQKGKCLLEPDLVKSLLTNIIDNSIKAMDGGGEIMVVQTMTKSGCRFTISDNGRGIPQEELMMIREAFYRVDKSRSRKQGGAGLGLSLCDEIVRLHDGTMTFYSEEGKGTKVIVELGG